MNKEHFRGVVYPKGEVAPGQFQYVVVGVIVSDKPLDVGFTHSDGYLDGSTGGGLLDLLGCLGKYKAPHRFGDAGSLLTALGACDPANDGPVTQKNDRSLLKGYQLPDPKR